MGPEKCASRSLAREQVQCHVPLVRQQGPSAPWELPHFITTADPTTPKSGFVDGLQGISFLHTCHPSYGDLALAPAGFTFPLNTLAFIGHTEYLDTTTLVLPPTGFESRIAAERGQGVVQRLLEGGRIIRGDQDASNSSFRLIDDDMFQEVRPIQLERRTEVLQL